MDRGDIRIVVIGGSAGSIPPVEKIIADLPADFGADLVTRRAFTPRYCDFPDLVEASLWTRAGRRFINLRPLCE